MQRPQVDVIVGGQWGSEGKGNVVSAIAGKYDTLVRTGGPNAGHQVVAPDGRTITFHHLPSGSLHNLGARIILGPGAVINPKAFMHELEVTGVAADRISIDPQAAVITEQDIDSDHAFDHIGSTGQGVGSALIKKLQRGSHPNKTVLVRDEPSLASMVRPTLSLYRESHRVLVEGTQGTLLSVHHGDWPYVTSRCTSVANHLAEAGLPVTSVNRVIGVFRTYPIRVQSPQDGSSGPMGDEISWEDVAAEGGLDAADLRVREKTSTTKRQRRVARFSMDFFEKSCRINGYTDIALTFADYFKTQDKVDNFVRILEARVDIPVTIVSWGFGADKVKLSGVWA